MWEGGIVLGYTVGRLHGGGFTYSWKIKGAHYLATNV
jgi:hypothetical protein